MLIARFAATVTMLERLAALEPVLRSAGCASRVTLEGECVVIRVDGAAQALRRAEAILSTVD